MSQNLISSLTLRIENEKKMMQEHQESIESFHQNTEGLLTSAEKSLKSLQGNVNSTTEGVTKQLYSAQQQIQSLTDFLSQQSKKITQLEDQSTHLSKISQEIAQTAQLKKHLFTSTIILASITAILLLSSLFLGYLSKNKLSEIQEKEERLQRIELATEEQIQEYGKMMALTSTLKAERRK